MLQPPETLPRNDHTLHILCSYAGVSVQQARQKYVPAFLNNVKNKEWLTSVCGEFLNKKKVTMDSYLAQLLAGNIPCDEVAVMLVAMAFNIHFGIYYGEDYWCTNADLDPWGWDGILIYAGKMRFIDTKVGEANREQCYRIAGITAPTPAANESDAEDAIDEPASTESPELDDPADSDYKPTASQKTVHKRKKRTKSFTTLLHHSTP